MGKSASLMFHEGVLKTLLKTAAGTGSSKASLSTFIYTPVRLPNGIICKVYGPAPRIKDVPRDVRPPTKDELAAMNRKLDEAERQLARF